MTDLKRWRGLRALVSDAVEHGTSAIERVHLQTASRPFEVLKQIPGVREPAEAVRVVHDTLVSNTYQTVRAVNQVVGAALDAALAALDKDSEADAETGTRNEGQHKAEH